LAISITPGSSERGEVADGLVGGGQEVGKGHGLKGKLAVLLELPDY